MITYFLSFIGWLLIVILEILLQELFWKSVFSLLLTKFWLLIGIWLMVLGDVRLLFNTIKSCSDIFIFSSGSIRINVASSIFVDTNSSIIDLGTNSSVS